ncbi:hypothetical protein L226DRAFT_609832 [Lentinus tigrinus ALCF2SS1-7]|uniref:uncharacterized protein n=1 Tax=Lentinus tigrinus ALCF2SS1-7 TaxID=1328758 RepID=UPI001166103A|nr:hypothetical protein L226DRAFT_609832 [Lentinus tigrinus ALCF2SS1-7]
MEPSLTQNTMNAHDSQPASGVIPPRFRHSAERYHQLAKLHLKNRHTTRESDRNNLPAQRHTPASQLSDATLLVRSQRYVSALGTGEALRGLNLNLLSREEMEMLVGELEETERQVHELRGLIVERMKRLPPEDTNGDSGKENTPLVVKRKNTRAKFSGPPTQGSRQSSRVRKLAESKMHTAKEGGPLEAKEEAAKTTKGGKKTASEPKEDTKTSRSGKKAEVKTASGSKKSGRGSRR